MKKTVSLLLLTVMLLSLCACGGKGEKKELDAAALSESLLKGDLFSVSLEELPAGKVSAFYEIPADSVEDAVLYHAAGTSKEQIVILKAVDNRTAENAVTILKGLVNQWIEADKDYAPQEVPKLEKAVLRQSGAWVLLVVAADPDAAARLVGEYF